MWRAFFLGLGITCVIFGAGCTVVDRLILVPKSAPPPAAATGFQTEPAQTSQDASCQSGNNSERGRDYRGYRLNERGCVFR